MTQSIATLVNELKDNDQDFEFYPTTNEIISELISDLKDRLNYSRNSSFLDIGAGNGKVLSAVKAADLELSSFYAIEKSSLLCQQIDKDVLIVGTDFHQQSLWSKSIDVTFCNPPYREFEIWAEKIIRESASSLIYLVIPKRWDKSVKIADAVRFREARIESVGEFDFEDAEDRAARAKVSLLRVEFKSRDRNDAFERFFEEQFGGLIDKFKKPVKSEGDEDGPTDSEDPIKSIPNGPALPEMMVEAYNQEMVKIQKNYHLVSELDVELLKEFEISPKKIMELLLERLTNLKNKYWQELFSRLDAIADRLTSQSRKNILTSLNQHSSVDFTVSNIYEIILWVIRNANDYIDSQLISTYELMVDKANVKLYKSNKRVWEEDRWRYADQTKNTHFALDYRIVTHRIGGIGQGTWSHNTGLEERAADFIGDMLTIARNMGFRCPSWARDPISYHGRKDWKSGERHEFRFSNSKHQNGILMDVKAFKNGNLHIRFNQDFMLALNVEHGRLKGWIKTPKEAVEELQDPQAATYFHSNIQIGNSVSLLLSA